MQGRLSPMVNGRIQAFPWDTWQDEFPVAERLGLRLMEWTLDQERLYDNPLLTRQGQARIRALCGGHGVAIPSLTGDCFMQAPFWKAGGAIATALQNDFRAVVRACAVVGIPIIVVPLVDNGRLEDEAQLGVLVSFLQSETADLKKLGVRVAFESDFGPQDLARFIARLDSDTFGINYDIGNSAALGFSPADEIAAYGSRIINVHVKDRPLNGSTVPLGTGAADFSTVFRGLSGARYGGNYILQTARAADGDHAGVLDRYRQLTEEWIAHYEA